MALYRYRVSDQNGQVQELLVEGDSQNDAVRRLQRRNVIPLEFLGEGSQSSSAAGWLPFKQRFDVIDFTDRLVPLLEAGIPLERALGILAEGSEDETTTDVIQDLRRGLHEGRSFSQLIQERQKLFPPIYASAVTAGEEAGALPRVMKELQRFLNDSREMRSYIVSASVYPLIVLAVCLIVIGVLLTVIIPRFAAAVTGAGRELGSATKGLLAVSDVVQSYWWVLPLLIVAGVVFVRQLKTKPRWRAVWDAFKLKLPVLGTLTSLANLSRLSRTMSILMNSGVHLLNTVTISAKIVQNSAIRQSLEGVGAELRQGSRLSQAIGKSPYMPTFMLRMIGVGEETGDVAGMLERVAERYENDLTRLTRRLLSMFEPLIIVFLGLLVGGIVLTMFMAIMNMQGTL